MGRRAGATEVAPGTLSKARVPADARLDSAILAGPSSQEPQKVVRKPLAMRSHGSSSRTRLRGDRPAGGRGANLLTGLSMARTC